MAMVIVDGRTAVEFRFRLCELAGAKPFHASSGLRSPLTLLIGTCSHVPCVQQLGALPMFDRPDGVAAGRRPMKHGPCVSLTVEVCLLPTLCAWLLLLPLPIWPLGCVLVG